MRAPRAIGCRGLRYSAPVYLEPAASCSLSLYALVFRSLRPRLRRNPISYIAWTMVGRRSVRVHGGRARGKSFTEFRIRSDVQISKRNKQRLTKNARQSRSDSRLWV